MSGVRLRARGPAAVLGSRLFGKALSFAFIVVLVRSVGEEDVAAYSYLVALALTFSILSDTGVSVIAGRDVARGDVGVAAAYRAGLAAVLGGCVIGALAVAA
ncbi:MAG TPA: oligosaccharide flippase family protein, partial [Miltoncostaea sp.]|nr:oligosaccharide flippase family protein [Miltoncostaea sp.]